MGSTKELYSFYELVDPRDLLPFYIGQTLSFERRKRDYLAGRPHSIPLDKRLQELKQLGLEPIMQELEQIECTFTEALERENYWIKRRTNQGILLLNVLNNKQERRGQYVYLPPDLIRYLKYQAADRELEISEVVEEAIREHQERHQG